MTAGAAPRQDRPVSIGRSHEARFTRTVRAADPDDVRAFLARAAEQPAPTVPTVADLEAERDAERQAPVGKGFGTVDVPGRDGPIEARECRADGESALVINLHASGWVRGLASWTDGVAAVLRDEFAITSAAPEYRLAPKHPHPAGADDAYDTLCWALETAESPVFLLGSSAGAHLGTLAVLRLRRDRPDLLARLRGVVLSYGIYDLSRTPSMRRAPAGTPVVSPVPQAQYLDWAFPGTDDEQRRAPELSPLFDDLTGLPPALFAACERDPLRDDSLFMSARWADAGNDTDLDVWTDCVHSFDRHYPVTGRRYAQHVGEWLVAHRG